MCATLLFNSIYVCWQDGGSIISAISLFTIASTWVDLKRCFWAVYDELLRNNLAGEPEDNLCNIIVWQDACCA
jgi:hypothetical protein